MKKVRHKHYLLIEVLIALALLTLAFMPIISPQILQYSAQKKLIQEAELQRIALEKFIDLKELLYQNKIPLSDIVQKNKYTTMNFGSGMVYNLTLPPPYEKFQSDCELFRMSKKAGLKESMSTDQYPIHLIVIKMRFAPPNTKFNNTHPTYEFYIAVEKKNV